MIRAALISMALISATAAGPVLAAASGGARVLNDANGTSVGVHADHAATRAEVDNDIRAAYREAALARAEGRRAAAEGLREAREGLREAAEGRRGAEIARAQAQAAVSEARQAAAEGRREAEDARAQAWRIGANLD